MTFGAGILFFPVSYVIGDVLTEVYGYANARRCIWMGFAALLFMAFMSCGGRGLPPAAGLRRAGSGAVAGARLGELPDDLCPCSAIPGASSLASMVAFWAGEFVNSFVLAKMKILTAGRHLWTRTIGSTVFGQAARQPDLLPAGLPRPRRVADEQLMQVMLSNG